MTKETNKRDKTIRVYAEQKDISINDSKKQRPENFEIYVYSKTGKIIDYCMTDREDLVAGILFYMQYTYNVHQEDTQWETLRDASSLKRIRKSYYNN